MDSKPNSGKTLLFLVAVIVFFITVAVLKITVSIILPVVIALLLALVMSPLVRLLEKVRIPRAVSIILAGVTVIASLIGVGAVFYSSGRSIMRTYSRYEGRIEDIYKWIARVFEMSYDDDLSVMQNLWAQLGNQIRMFTISASNSFLAFLKDALMVTLFTVFFLFEGGTLREKLNVALEGERALQIQTMSTDIALQVSRYLSIKFFISVSNGILVALFLGLAGLEFAVIWGIAQFFMNFIPTLGSIAVGVLASLFALIQFWPEPGPVILIVGIMLGTNIVIGNLLEPKIMGDRLGLSPISVLVSLFFWGWLWGFAGMVIAVPMMVIIKIVCENIPALEPVAVLFASHRSVLAKKAKHEKEAEERSDLSSDV